MMKKSASKFLGFMYLLSMLTCAQAQTPDHVLECFAEDNLEYFLFLEREDFEASSSRCTENNGTLALIDKTSQMTFVIAAANALGVGANNDLEDAFYIGKSLANLCF